MINDYIYIVFLARVPYYLPLSHAFAHTLTYADSCELPCKVQAP